MATVTDNGQTHALVDAVVGHELLEPLRQVLELGSVGQARLKQFGLHLDLVGEILQRGAFQVSLMLHWRDSGLRSIVVGAPELVKRARPAHILGVLLLLSIILVDRHHVLHVVSSGGEVRPLGDPAAVLLHEDLLVLRNETFLWLVVESTQNLALEAFGSVVRVALSVEVLRVDSRDKASVPWNALVSNLMRRSVHPGARRLAHVTAHGDFLWRLVGAVDGGGTHLLGDLLLLQDSRARVNHGGLPRVPEVISSLAIALSCRVPDNVQLEGNMTGITRDFLSTLHLLAVALK